MEKSKIFVNKVNKFEEYKMNDTISIYIKIYLKAYITNYILKKTIK